MPNSLKDSLKVFFKNSNLWLVVEVLAVIAWAVYVGKPYFNLDENLIPAGREWGSAVMSHHVWSNFQSCGACMFWNGFHSGGFPALADPFTSAFHPIVIISTLALGVVNGAKISIVLALAVAGIAQWWLAYELDLGRIPRLWSAGIAIVGGHLVGRMDTGAFGLLFSVAMVSLLFPALLYLRRVKSNRAILALGFVGASALLSGQAYLQVGFLGLAPAGLFLLLDENCKLDSLWKKYLLSLLLALLLTAPVALPFLQTVGQMAKAGVEANFAFSQPLQYLPFNLVISDGDFYRTQVLGKIISPNTNVLYIGWVAVLLALAGLAYKPRQRQIYLYMFSGIILGFLMGSAVSLKWLAHILPFVTGFRFTSLLVIPSVTLILAFSATGLDWLLTHKWSDFYFGFGDDTCKPFFRLPLQWLIVIPLVLSLVNGYAFSRQWLRSAEQNDGVFETLKALNSGKAAWLLPPFGEQFWNEEAAGMGLKIADNLNGFVWAERELPPPDRIALREEPEIPLTKITELNGIGIYAEDEIHYAYLTDKNGAISPCPAKSTGGLITLTCNSSSGGTLTITENNWSGWQAQIDGISTSVLLSNSFINISDVPSGEHKIVLRYQPWDVYLGLAVMLLSIIASFWLCYTPRRMS